MEAWRQYRVFRPDQVESSLNHHLAEKSRANLHTSSPSASSTSTLREPTYLNEGNGINREKEQGAQSAKVGFPGPEPDNPSPPSSPLATIPPPLPDEQPSATMSNNGSTDQNPTTANTFTLPPTAEKPDDPVYVSFLPGDSSNPQNWSSIYKAWVVFLLTFLTLSLTYASSASSSAETGIMEEFGCEEVAATASTGLFLLGMGLGAMPAAPLSERE